MSRVRRRLGLLVGLPALWLSGWAACSGADVAERFRDDRTGASAAVLALARRAFDAYVLRRERIFVPEGLPPLLKERSGVFVSAALDNAPRCCMGALRPTQPTLAEEIIAAAVAAAGYDARRKPVKPEELARLQLIVSVVSEPEAIQTPDGLDPARDGLAARGQHRTGVVLPGETRHRDLVVKWARTRAGVDDEDSVDYFRIRAFRIPEPSKR
jgi:AMMECR1 domain-containing protein